MSIDYEAILYTCQQECESARKECELSGTGTHRCLEDDQACMKKCDRIKGWDGRFWS